MLLMTMFIIGHMEIGNGYCRTDLLLENDPISMEYPCKYYSELREVDNMLKKLEE